MIFSATRSCCCCTRLNHSNVILALQGSPYGNVPQIPSIAAGLPGATSDRNYLESLGVELAINGAGWTPSTNETVSGWDEVFPTVTSFVRSTAFEPEDVGGVTTGVADRYYDQDLPPHPVNNPRFKGTIHPDFREQAGTGRTSQYGVSFDDLDWFVVNIEPEMVVSAQNYHEPGTRSDYPIRTKPSGDGITDSGALWLTYLRTDNSHRNDVPKWRQTKKILREIASRYPNYYSFDESKITGLDSVSSPGTAAVPTYNEVFDALISMQNGIVNWIRKSPLEGSSPEVPLWTKKIVNDWRHGIGGGGIVPFVSPWWKSGVLTESSPGYSGHVGVTPNGNFLPGSSHPEAPTYAPHLACRGSSLTSGTPYLCSYVASDGTLKGWTAAGPTMPSNISSMSDYLAKVREKCLNTARNASYMSPLVEAISVSLYDEITTNSLYDIDPSTTFGDYIAVSWQGTGNLPSGAKYGALFLPREEARNSLHYGTRQAWLASWKHLKEKSALWINGAIGHTHLSSSPTWGLSSTPSELKQLLGYVLAPVTQQEIDDFGLSGDMTAGDVPGPGNIFVWTADQQYLQTLFTNNGGNDPVSEPSGVTLPDPDNSEMSINAGRANLTRRARARGITASASWDRSTYNSNTNSWYHSLARMLTDDLLDRCNAVVEAVNDSSPSCSDRECLDSDYHYYEVESPTGCGCEAGCSHGRILKSLLADGLSGTICLNNDCELTNGLTCCTLTELVFLSDPCSIPPNSNICEFLIGPTSFS